MKKPLFNSDSDRNLWIKLMAEFGVEFQKKVNNYTVPLGSIDERYSCMYIANLKLMQDEESGKLRFTLEQLLTMDYEDYEVELRIQHAKLVNKFKNL